LIEDAADAQKVRTTDSPVQQWKEGRKKRGGREEGREGGGRCRQERSKCITHRRHSDRSMRGTHNIIYEAGRCRRRRRWFKVFHILDTDRVATEY
jgi:hypothetical protein